MHFHVRTPMLLFTSYAFAQEATTNASTSSVPTDALETSAPGVISPNYVLRGFEKCDAGQVVAIKKAFSDMLTMLMGDPQVGLYPEVDWNSAAAQDFWGPYALNSGARTHIRDNLNRAARVTYDWWIDPFAKRLHARCDDPLNQCICTQQGDVDAYVVEHGPEINFCPPFFGKPELGWALQNPIGGNWEYIDAFVNTASIFSHELMHIAQIGHPMKPGLDGIIDQAVVGWPGVFDHQSYGDYYTKWLAQDPTSTADRPVDNADNYALFFLANFIQKQLGYYPSRKVLPIFPDTLNALSEVNVTTGDFAAETAIGSYCYTGNY